MNIQLIDPDQNLKTTIETAAKTCGAIVAINSVGLRHCSFKLLNPSGNVASSQRHDKFFAAIFNSYPDCTIKTGRAVYEGIEDFNSQKAARVT